MQNKLVQTQGKVTQLQGKCLLVYMPCSHDTILFM
jgi:hypothetical protein